MNPQRKRTYIILAVLAVAASGFILWWGGIIGSRGLVEPESITAPTAVNTVPTQSADGTFTAPSVFPANPLLDTSVLNSSVFKSLTPYSIPTLQKTDLGRDDPFKPY